MPHATRAGEEALQLARGENAELKRALGQETFEKEASHKSCEELRAMVKRAEGERVDLSRVLQELRQKLAGESQPQACST